MVHFRQRRALSDEVIYHVYVFKFGQRVENHSRRQERNLNKLMSKSSMCWMLLGCWNFKLIDAYRLKSISRKVWFDGFSPWCTVIHEVIAIQLSSYFCAWTSWLSISLVTWHNFWRRSFDSEQQAYPDLTLLARLVRSKANCATAHKPLL